MWYYVFMPQQKNTNVLRFISEENTKLYIRGAFIIALFAFAYAQILSVNSFTKPLLNSPNFSVSAEGRVMAVPDIGQFSFSILTQGGMNIGDLQLQNTEKANNAIVFLKKSGIDTKDIQTQGYTILPLYQYPVCPPMIGSCPTPVITGYTVTQTIFVKERNLAKVGDLLTNVVNNGANSVSQLSFVIDDPVVFQKQASAKAIAQAKEKAQAMARAGGFRLGKLLSVQEYSNPLIAYNTPMSAGEMGMIKDNAQAVPTLTVEPGLQEVVSNVTLQFEIVK